MWDGCKGFWCQHSTVCSRHILGPINICSPPGSPSKDSGRCDTGPGRSPWFSRTRTLDPGPRTLDPDGPLGPYSRAGDTAEGANVVQKRKEATSSLNFSFQVLVGALTS